MIDGENILYHYLQKNLLESDVWLFQMLVSKLVAELGIWFSPDLYARMPIILPFAVRDPTCRRHASKDNIEEWGTPDSLGFFRDDNSLIKNLPASLKVVSSKRNLYNGSFIGKGFVASHIWREISGSRIGADLSTRDPWTNSFIPNLVWLPRQVSKLTDREGSFTQIYLQGLSMKIYRTISVPEPLREYTDYVWSMLPTPRTDIPEQGLPEIDELNFFECTQGFLSRRASTIEVVSNALGRVLENQPLQKKVVSTRYTENLPKVSTEQLRNLHMELSEYLSTLPIDD